MSSNGTHYYQQQPQYQYMTQDHASLVTSVGQHGSPGELAPHLDAAWINMHPHFGDSFTHSGNIAPEPTLQF